MPGRRVWGGQRSLLPVRAQRETGVGADVQPPWGNTACLGLCVLYEGPEDRAERVSTGV